jgi:serine protease Do
MKTAKYLIIVCTAVLACQFPAAAEDNRAEEDRILAQAQIVSQAFAIIAKRVRPAVVNIRVERTQTRTTGDFNDPTELFRELLRRRFPGRIPDAQPRTTVGQGSGVIVDERGYILTNNHVVGSADTIIVKLSDGKEFPAELIGTDPDSDVAVIKIETDHLTIAPTGDSDDCLVGESVLAIGNPFGLESTVTTGIISARGRSGVGIVEVEDFIQTDASINPGNSGGPLVNLKGEVIGINTAIYSKSGGSMGINFAIPINIARSIMQGIITNKRVTSSYLGLQLQKLTPELARSFGLESPQGALVIGVLADTPAAKAGIMRGDIIIKYGKREIKDDHQMRNLVATTSPGTDVTVELIRRGKAFATTVRLEAVPEEVAVRARTDKVLDSLGIEVAEFTTALGQRLGYEQGAWGVLVMSVGRRSEAARIGIRPGSLIMKVDESEVKTPEELRAALAAADIRKGFNLIWRTGRYVQRVRISVAE